MSAAILAKLLHLYDTHSLVYQDGSDVWYQQDAMELFEDARKALGDSRPVPECEKC